VIFDSSNAETPPSLTVIVSALTANQLSGRRKVTRGPASLLLRCEPGSPPPAPCGIAVRYATQFGPTSCCSTTRRTASQVSMVHCGLLPNEAATALSVGRFQDGVFVSAPVQLVPVSHPDAAEIASKAAVEVGPGRFLRRQQVVDIPRLEIDQSSFTGDLICVCASRPDPAQMVRTTNIRFPALIRGSFEAQHPAAGGEFGDGTTYRLWQVTGDFKNDFDLRRYPADRQNLVMRFFNANAASSPGWLSFV
jgi:hypothetical protein